MRSLALAGWLIVATVLVLVLIMAKNLLIPFVIALGIWYLINALKRFYRNIKIGDMRFPNWLCLSGAAGTILFFLFLIWEMVYGTVNAMRRSAPEYKVNLDRMLEPILQKLGIAQIPDFTTITNEIDLSAMVSLALNSISGIAGNIILILVYVGFLLFEQAVFPKKLAALFPGEDGLKNANNILNHINQSVQTYISVKTITSLLTGFFSYFVLIFVGVDFAIFWAFLIFLLNYIPTVGSLIATIFPALLALVQFGTFGPGIVVLIGVTGVQFIIGNILEPKLMGSSLNISPLVVILSLVLWGMIWGVAGMVLCVPITVIMMIILADFPETRFVAILLSGNGELPDLTKKPEKPRAPNSTGRIEEKV